MLLDARTLADTSRLETDICIVGGGVAGITLARELAGSDRRVLLLESGGLETEPDTQALDEGETSGFPYYPLETARARVLSGSSVLWHVPLGPKRVGARIRPMDGIDFEQRAAVPHSGWPFPKTHLDPFYDRAQAICQLEPATFAVDDWEDRRDRARLPLPANIVQTVIYKFVRRDRFVRGLRREVIGAGNVTTCLNATALEIETNDAGDRVTGVRAGTLAGDHRFMVNARQFVLAAGGIETPRLLLLSNRANRDGLGNAHDLVGRFFMEHLHFWSGILVPDDPGQVARMSLYTAIAQVGAVSVLGKLALAEAVIRREGLLNQNIQLIPAMLPDPFVYPRLRGRAVGSLAAMLHGSDSGHAGEHLRHVLGAWDKFARTGLKRIRKSLLGLPERPVFVFANMTEQSPNPESRVRLGTSVDAFGLRRVALHWEIAPADIRSVVRTQEIVAEALQKAGIGRVFRELTDDEAPRAALGDRHQRETHGGYHHMGTTRMHVDPRQGVVDADARVHGVDNLFIAGPSIFPTGGYANPILTIVALSVRLADHLKRLTMG